MKITELDKGNEIVETMDELNRFIDEMDDFIIEEKKEDTNSLKWVNSFRCYSNEYIEFMKKIRYSRQEELDKLEEEFFDL